jgi:threonine/homoserine/homoserine lactone efflux protein
MTESIITICITGLLAGFIFAMPIAGPISIMITSNALKGRLRYSNLVSIGASFADFTYVFIAVFGLTKMYSFLKPAMPYMFALGSLFFLILGYRIISTKFDIENIEGKSRLADKIKNKDKGGFYTGFMLNFLNPTLFIGSLTSSFFVISLIAALGFNTGGLEDKISQNVNEISNIEGMKIEKSHSISIEQLDKFKIHKSSAPEESPATFPSYFHLIISICYAFFLSLGSIAWFHFLAFMIVRHRQRINVNIISFLIRSLGFVLCLIGVYFGYLAVSKFL